MGGGGQEGAAGGRHVERQAYLPRGEGTLNTKQVTRSLHFKSQHQSQDNAISFVSL